MGVAIYDDRMEVTSSGSLHFGLTPEMLFEPHESLPWNPLIARTFYRRGMIEEWGRGTLKMAEVAIAAGLPHPEIADRGGGVTVRFWSGRPARSRTSDGDLTEQQRAILELLHESAFALALREIRSELAAVSSDRLLRRDLAVLRDRGLIRVEGHGRGARWRPS